VSSVLKIDERRDRPASMEEKVAAVRERLRGAPGRKRQAGI
jgi:uncharacterized protein YqgV (UPF0045/DUF77 family)